MEFILDINFWLITLCSTIGSIKASIEFDNDKPYLQRFIDVLIGIISGIALVHHYANQLSLGLSALIAIVGGAGGALVLETFLSLLPAVSKQFIQKWIKKFLD